MSREPFLAGICGEEKSSTWFSKITEGKNTLKLRVGAAVQVHAVLCQRVHWMDTEYLENKSDFIMFVYLHALSGAITLK